MARSSRGFTLVELLVVISIIGILVGLLLPAVQAAREAARRMTCDNNLKQFGLAMHNYHDVHKSFPRASSIDLTGFPGAITSNEAFAHWGWALSLLPYLEQNPLYDELDPSFSTLEQAFVNNVARLQNPLSVFICPSDPHGALNRNRPFLGSAGGASVQYSGPILIAKSNYVANNGDDNHDGIFLNTWPPRTTKMRDITDGTSNTIAISERDSPGSWAGVWAGGELCCAPVSNVWAVIGSTRMRIQDGEQGGASAAEPRMGFSSAHPGGAEFLFADGSVRFLSDTIEWGWWAGPNADVFTGRRHPSRDERGVYNYLGNRMDGHPVDIP